MDLRVLVAPGALLNRTVAFSAASSVQASTLGNPATGTVQSVITYDDVTFTLAAPTTVYASVTGDPMAIGPVQVTATAPAYSTAPGYAINGSEFNFAMAGTHTNQGVKSQGFDSFAATSMTMGYNSTYNVDPGFLGTAYPISEGTFVKSITRSSIASVARPSIQRLVPLTVLPAGTSVPTGAFRPGPYSTAKTIQYTTVDVRDVEQAFPRLPVTAGAPNVANLISWFKRVKPAQYLYGNEGRRHYANDNMASSSAYLGQKQGFASKSAEAALLLCCDIPATEKRDLAYCFVQNAIDLYDRFSAYPNEFILEGGGLQCGYKVHLVVGAYLLNDPGMKAIAADDRKFHEDRQLFYVPSGLIGKTTTTLDQGFTPYEPQDLGMPEWADAWAKSSSRNTRALNGKYGGTYRGANGHLMGVAALGHIVPEIKTIWANQVLWDYVDRLTNWFYARPSVDGTNCPSAFVISMFQAYRDTYGEPRVWGPDWS